MRRGRMRLVMVICMLAGAVSGCGDDSSPMGGDAAMGRDAGSMGDGGGGGCPAEVAVDSDVTTDTQWDCPVYVLTRKVFVTGDSTLTIAPGTTVLGDTAGTEEAALIVTRGSRLLARGTAEEPIVFTSGNPPGARVTGDWAGVALLGAASVNSGSCVDDGDPSTAEVCDAPGFFEGRLEGLDVADVRGVFGGTDDTSSCGELSYVRIEFAGAELSPDNELNGLTLAGCGSGTTISHVQVHRAKDDGIELFGGSANLDHIIVSGASDDSLDCDLGWRGHGQFLVLHQFPGIGDNGIECDNLGSDEDAEPRTNPTLFNVTMIGTPDTRGMVLREGMRGTLRNFIVTGFGSEPVDIRAAQVDLSAEWPTHLSIESSFFYDNGPYADESGDDDDDMGFAEQAAIEDPARSNTVGVDPGLGDTSATAPDYVPSNPALAGQATPTFGDTTATFAGAFQPGASMSWAAGWTAYPEN